jgi:hypothetical protein
MVGKPGVFSDALAKQSECKYRGGKLWLKMAFDSGEQ